jgi:hypothetical protein
MESLMRREVDDQRNRSRRRGGDAYRLAGGDGAWGEREQPGCAQRAHGLVVHDGATVTVLPLDVPARNGCSQRAVQCLDADEEHQGRGDHDGADSGLREGEARHTV